METKCNKCKGININKDGTRKTLNRGNIQRYYCKDCKIRFVPNDGFYRMRNSPDKITQSIHLYYSGTSLRKTQAHLGVFHPHNASHVSILKWIRKYSRLVGSFVDNIKVKNSDSITFDEMEYKTKGKQSFFIDLMDMETRYILGSGYYLNRGMNEMREVLHKAKHKSLNPTTKFYTDGLKLYPRALRKEYNYNKKNYKYIHKITKSTDKAFNWKIERLHNSIRERTKIMRQFKKLESARLIMKGYEIHYNFARKHMGINAYPYELATDITLGKNKWLDLITISSNR